MNTDKPRFSYESAYGGRQEVELMISAYTMNDNLYVGLKGIETDGETSHFADLTVNIPSAPALEPFQAAIDIEHLGQLDAMNFLTENGLATHTGKSLPSGYMVFPVYEFDAKKLAEADPEGFKDYLRIVGLEEHQVEENSIEDLTSMAKARFLERIAEDEPKEPPGDISQKDPFDEIPDALRAEDSLEDDDEEFTRPPISDADLPDTGKPFLDYDTSYGDTEKVNVEVATYQDNDNLYVGLSFYDPELGGMDFYGDVTVNIVSLDPWVAAIDTNNNNAEKIAAFLKENGIAEPTGGALPSGFCMYPVFEFNPERLAELDPKGFAQHCRDAGIEFKPKELACERNADHPKRPEYVYITSYGQLEKVTLDVGAYENGGLCMTMESFDMDMGDRVRFPDATVDAGKALPPLTAAIDVETHGEEIMEFLAGSGFGEPTGESLTVGGCECPLFCFNEGKLVEADPRGFKQYCREAGVEPGQGKEEEDSLENARKQAKERAAGKNLNHPDRSRRPDMEL